MMNKLIATVLAASAFLVAPVFAQDAPTATTNTVVKLSDFETAPDGVSILAIGADSFRLIAIATAPYTNNVPITVSKARTVAITKAKGELSRFLNEKVELESFLEKNVSKVRVVSFDGSISIAQAASRQILTRIRTLSKSLLRGVTVLQTEKIPSADGPGGSFRALVGVSSATLEGSESLEAGIEAAGPKTIYP